MNNKKGFTLVELIVSFAIITAVSLAFFRTILVLQQQQLKNIAKNSYKAFTVVLNNSIQKDFLQDNIEKIISCGENCYDITYTTNGIVRLSIDKENNTITYGNIKEKLPKDFKFINNIEFTSYINSYEGNDSYVALNLNIKSNYEKNIQNIKYVYQYDSDNGIIELDVDGAEASDIIEYLLYSSPDANGLYEPLLPDGTSTGIRYRGENPNNYVYFNCEDKDSSNVSYGEDGYDYKNACEIWRIIGVFDVDNGNGNIEKRVKIINTKSTFKASWDSSASDVNSGYGINQWGESKYEDGSSYDGADLMQLLNGFYIGKSDSECKYCNGSGQSTCIQTCTVESLKSVNMQPLTSNTKRMIENVKWNVGAWDITNNVVLNKNTNTLNTVNLYKNEKSNTNGKLCNQSDPLCNDNVVRTTDWVGLVGLLYLTDWGYASSENICRINLYDGIENNNITCKKNNWMHTKILNEEMMWILTPVARNDSAYRASTIFGTGAIYSDYAFHSYLVYPSLYLKSNITFIGNGTGTEESPYILGINE